MKNLEGSRTFCAVSFSLGLCSPCCPGADLLDLPGSIRSRMTALKECGDSSSCGLFGHQCLLSYILAILYLRGTFVNCLRSEILCCCHGPSLAFSHYYPRPTHQSPLRIAPTWALDKVPDSFFGLLSYQTQPSLV